MPNYIVRLKIGQKQFTARTEAQDRFSAEMKARGAALRKFPGDSVAVLGCVEDFEKTFNDIMGGIFK